MTAADVVLVIAPHPDDELLGVGGTIARLVTEGHRVVVTIVTKGDDQLFSADLIEEGRREALRAHDLLGVAETSFLEFPAARLDEVPQHKLNAALGQVVERSQPDIIFMPFRGDIHSDHRLVADATLVSIRPLPNNSIRETYAYETLSETFWNSRAQGAVTFAPDFFVRLEEEQLTRKLDALAIYKSQLNDFPHERSLTAVESLARHRGATVSHAAAEAFMTVRRIM